MLSPPWRQRRWRGIGGFQHILIAQIAGLAEQLSQRRWKEWDFLRLIIRRGNYYCIDGTIVIRRRRYSNGQSLAERVVREPPVAWPHHQLSLSSSPCLIHNHISLFLPTRTKTFNSCFSIYLSSNKMSRRYDSRVFTILSTLLSGLR
jgi:hypothetical protein